jgi:hypothetical protein
MPVKNIFSLQKNKNKNIKTCISYNTALAQGKQEESTI